MGQIPPMLGKKHSKETIKKMQQIKKEVPVWNKGKKMSKESIEKNRLTHTGKMSC